MNLSIIKYICTTILLVVIGLYSCNIKEDMSGCPGYFLLDYTAYSDEVLEEIDPQSVVNVYVFDTKDVCSDILSFTYAELKEREFELDVPIQFLGRNVVVWHGNDSPDYDDETMKVGVPLDDFYLRLNKNTKNGIGHAPSMLWASEVEKVDFCTKITRHRIHMMRLHTTINVAVDIKKGEGIVERADMDSFNINIETASDVYNEDCEICSQSKLLVYDNSDKLDPNTQRWATAGTLRLSPITPCTLYITDSSTGNRINFGGNSTLDLISYMLKNRDLSTTQDIDDQRFLDLNKEWDIKLTIDGSFVALSLSINGWTTWFEGTDL